jgi:glycosyltransferase involved in cell wall biosynthesis
MLSTLILTHNEQHDLPGCLDSIAWCDDIHVLDSNSTDRTLEIARQRGAHTHTRAFDNFAAQRNAGMAFPFKHPWVLVLDADERPTPALSAEMQQAVAAAPATTSAYRIRRRDFLWGTWLKHAQMSPFYLRLLRVGHATYTREINEIANIDGDIADLQSPLDHLAFSKGIAHWIARHNTYSTREAQLLADGHATHAASLRQALFGPDFHTRRAAQKAIFYRLPLRPIIKWIYLVFVRGAFLDGRAGLTYTMLICFYESMIAAKHQELLRQRANKPL